MSESTSFVLTLEDRVECGSSEDALSSRRLHTESFTSALPCPALPHPVRSYLVVICRMQLHNADWCTAGATFQRKFIDRRMTVGRCTVQFEFSALVCCAKLLVINIVLHTSSFCCDGEVAVQMASVDQRSESDPDRN